jgi:hypothetical protein
LNKRKDEKPHLVDPTADRVAAEAMAEFCRQAGLAIQQLIGPLEILSHLLYLANDSADRPAEAREYLAQAQEHARTVIRTHADLLHAYPGPRLERS